MRMKITVPNSLSEIKLSQYQKFLQIQKNNEDEHFLASKMIEILLKKILYKNSPNLLKSNKILNLKNTIDLQKD